SRICGIDVARFAVLFPRATRYLCDRCSKVRHPYCEGHDWNESERYGCSIELGSGFISGLNINAENEFYYDLTSMPENEQNAQVLAYCRNHPSEAVMNAGLNLAQTYLSRKPMPR